MIELNSSEKEQILSGILNSADFKDSKRYHDLLKYLVEKSEKDGSIKEIEIAIEVFGKDASFDPNTNPLIRSYISNLRKKLEHYYLTTEDQYSYKIEIPKGQYLVNYVQTSNSNGNKSSGKQKYYFYLAVIILLVFFAVYETLYHPFSSKYTSVSVVIPNPIWTGFLQKNREPTLIVLGDYLFMTKKERGPDRIFIRNTKINNDKEFQEYEKKYPQIYGQYEKLNFTYLRPSSSFGLLEILRVFGNSSSDVTVRLASQLKWEDLEKHNLIFIGTFKTLYKLDTLISKTNIKFGVEPSSLDITDGHEDTVKSFKVSWIASNYQKDYGVLIKIPGSENNSILFCLGFSEMGVMDAVSSAIDPNLVSRIESFTGNDMPKTPLYFALVSQCEGIDLTAFHSTLKYFGTFSPATFTK